MKNIETITIDVAMHSEPWKNHNPHEVVRVEMDYEMLEIFCYMMKKKTEEIVEQIKCGMDYWLNGTTEDTTNC